MDSIAAQPSPPVGSSNRNSASRIAHLFKPLRKSSSSRDLQQYSNYEEYAQPTQSPSSPWEVTSNPAESQAQSFQRSSATTYTPPTPFGFTSNKARISRALAEGGAGGSDSYRASDRDYYIPYRGPISPPSHYSSTFGQNQEDEKVTDRRLFLHPEKHYQYQSQLDSTPLMSTLNNNNDWLDKENRPSRVEIPRYKDVGGNLLGLGLGMGQTETKKGFGLASDTATAKNRSLLGSGLPSAYTHGGNAPVVDTTSATRSVANQSYLPSLLRFDPEAVERSGTNTRPIREINFTSQGTIATRQPPAPSASTRKSTSANSSPAMTFPSLMRQSNSVDRPSHTKAGSITSSDDHGSSLINEGSASTSMTSLRDQSILHGKFRPSHEGPPMRGSLRGRGRAYTSSSTLDKGKGKLDESQHQTAPLVFARDFVAVQPDSSASDSTHQSRSESHSTNLPVHYRSNEFTASMGPPLSPISASTPGHQHEFSPGQAGGRLMSGSKQSAIDALEADRIKEKRASRMSEAHRNYLLLQQLHLDELTSHSTDYAGYLDTKNGCERIMMPRPSLRGRESFHQDYEHGRQESTPAVAFERHRRLQTKSTPQLYDAARTQEILGRGYQPGSVRSQRDSVPLFHHRMPPPTPDDKPSIQFALPAHVKIPPRRSSQARRRMEASPATPALTPNLASDGDSDDDNDDLATVLAQGIALEEEREQWREQYRRSVGKSKSHGALRAKSRDGTTKRVRYGQEPLPDLKTFHKHADPRSRDQSRIRPAKSSPDLRNRGGDWQDDSDGSQGVPTMCMAFQSIAHTRGRTPMRKAHPTRLRSQDSPHAWPSSSSGSIPCLPGLGRRRRARTMTSEHEKHRRMSQAQLDVFGVHPASSRIPRHFASQPQLMSDEPVIIGRQSMPTEVVPSIAQSSGEATRFRFPNQPTTVASSDPNAYGIAFSAPRPDIGHSAPKDPTFVAGRHATKLGYHRPTNSDDLRAMLSSHPSSTYSSDDGSHQAAPKRISRKQPPVYAAPLSGQERPSAMRSDSLGMSQVRQSIDDKKQAPVGVIGEVEIEQKSLPVPPRRQRSSQAISSSESPLVTSGNISTGTGGAPALAFTTPFVALEGFSPSTAFATPTLGQPWHAEGERGEGFFVKDAGKGTSETGVRSCLQSNRSSEGERVAGSSQVVLQQQEEVERVGKMRSVVGQSSSSSEDSNYSPRSVAARELWNTDEHEEESFSGLFFRRPSVGNSGLRQAMTMNQDANTNRPDTEQTVTTPRLRQKSKKVAGEASEMEAPTTPTLTNRYRTSLQERRNSDEIEKVVGSYLNYATGEGRGDESMDSSFTGSATTDTSIGSQKRREEARLGRVGDRRPMIQKAYRPADDQEESTDDDDDTQTLNRGKTRARLTSFSASLILAGEDSPTDIGVEKGLPPLPVQGSNAGQQ